jgi:hypothetical protein
MVKATFCLCPLGWAPWSPRIFESVQIGCIPVIIADDIILPFEKYFNWERIAVRVKEADVPRLEEILKGFPPEKVGQADNVVLLLYFWFRVIVTNWEIFLGNLKEVPCKQMRRTDSVFSSLIFLCVIYTIVLGLLNAASSKEVQKSSPLFLWVSPSIWRARLKVYGQSSPRPLHVFHPLRFSSFSER